MQLLAVSISHKTAPLSVREKTAFTKKKQAEILRFIKQNIAVECVLVSTCNRCEFYLASDADIKKPFLDYLKTLTGGFNIAPYLEIYRDFDAVSHLMSTTAGLLSMVVGEDQILGQIKEAHGLAVENGASGIYFNTLFRLAITGAKRVKTETLLSKTPVSAATIAIKLCEKALGTLKDKNALIIGATGKMGNIIFKDLRSLNRVNLFVTARTRETVPFSDFDGAEIIDYSDRYDYIDKMDIIISATSSPHYTLTAEKINSAVKTKKDRIFIDLAVPKDIEEDGGYIYKNIDNLRELSEINNKKKLKEARKAEKILEKYINEFLVWQIFYENKAFIDGIEFENEDERNCFRHKIYNAKAAMNYIDFGRFVKDLKQ